MNGNRIVQDLLKHCPVGHPDHGSLLLALEAMCSLAEKMNRSEEQATNLELLKELEFSFNGVVPGLVAPHRQLVRKDRVSEVIGNQTKDRLMIMLNDVLLCATVRRRTGSKKGTGYVIGLHVCEKMVIKYLGQCAFLLCISVSVL